MDQAYEKYEREQAQSDRFPLRGNFFARDQNDAAVNERRQDSIRAITERTEQKIADGRADAAEYHAARNKYDERDRGE